MFGFPRPSGSDNDATIDAMLDLVRPASGWIHGRDQQRYPRPVRGGVGVLSVASGFYRMDTGRGDPGSRPTYYAPAVSTIGTGPPLFIPDLAANGRTKPKNC